MNHFESIQPSIDTEIKHCALEAMQNNSNVASSPGYPTERLYWDDPGIVPTSETTDGWPYFPTGPWEMNRGENPSEDEINDFRQQNVAVARFAGHYRPLHPWWMEMLSDPDIGVVTGRGFYWRWGPNKTADPVAIADDTKAVLLIKKHGAQHWALPGGFMDGGEQDAQLVAQRELHEETGVETRLMSGLKIVELYRGPVDDSRCTINAWPETVAYKIPVPYEMPIKIQDTDEIEAAAWVSPDRLSDFMTVGSHRYLVELALKTEV